MHIPQHSQLYLRLSCSVCEVLCEGSSSLKIREQFSWLVVIGFATQVVEFCKKSSSPLQFFDCIG